MKIIKFDLDGVLLEEKPTFERALARPIPGMKDLIKRLRQASNTIIIETGRGWAEHKLTVHQLEEAGIEYDLLLMGKATYDYVIDDRAIEFKGNAKEIELRLFNNNDFDAYSIYQVRKATYEFLLSLRLQGNVLELGAMKRDEMPFPEFYVEPEMYYQGNYRNTQDFFGECSQGYNHIIAVNVLEHMEYIWNFPGHVNNLLKPNGKVYILTPYNIRFHGPKPHLWNFTDTGLNYLMRNFKLVNMKYYGKPTKPYAISAVYQKRDRENEELMDSNTFTLNSLSRTFSPLPAGTE